ncbi:MAG: hypothetical protein Q4F60_00925 [Candidatus Saccharibacteria bacterium]|nr:hypothetical protein [Candidatus Saccharibacteria bacterium]
MTRRLDFNIFSLGAIALGITIIVSLFAGIAAHNPPSSDSPYSLNLERSSSGSYLNLLVAESEEDTSLKIHTDNYTAPTTPAPVVPPQSESAPESPRASSITIRPSSLPKTPEASEPSPAPESTIEPSPSPESDSTLNAEALISEFNSLDEKISTLLDQLNAELDRLYPEKIIYQPELDVLYPALSELSQLITRESDFLADYSDELPDFYHKRHESNLSAFSALRDRLDYLLKNLKPLSEDINTYSYASLCKTLIDSADSSTSEPSASPVPSDSQEDSELSSEPTAEPSPTEPSEELSPSDSSTTPDSAESEQTNIPLDGFDLPICSSASYVAEKASDFYSLTFSNWGSPESWHEFAASLGYAVDNSPSAHSIGIDLSGSSPHFIWVESLSSPSATPIAATPTSSPVLTPSPDSSSTPSPTASALPVDPVLINLSEYDNILTPLNFSYRTNISASSYIFIHLDQPAPSNNSTSPEESPDTTQEDSPVSNLPEPDNSSN